MSTLKIEGLLADYHAEVWAAAERGGQYDLAGVEVAEKLLAEIRAYPMQEMRLTAWATGDGRVAMDATKQCMPSASRDNFNIPLYAEQSRLMLGDDTSPRAPEVIAARVLPRRYSDEALTPAIDTDEGIIKFAEQYGEFRPSVWDTGIPQFHAGQPGVILMVRALATRPTWPESLTPELTEALGTLNFHTGPLAHLFRATGSGIPRKCENEQAFILHWMAGLVLKHGAEWRTYASAKIAELRAMLPKGSDK